MASLFISDKSDNRSKANTLLHKLNQFKQSVFLLFHVSLENVKRSSYDIFLLSTFDCLQCISYSFVLAFNQTWNIQEYTAIHYYINKFLTIFLLTPYFMESSYNMFLVAYIGCIIFVFVIIGLFAYLIYVIQSNAILSKWHLNLFDVIARYYSGIFFIPILKAILPLFYCNKFIKEHEVLYEKDIGYCSSIEAIVFTLLSSITIIPCISFAFLFSSLYFDIRMTQANHMSRLSPKYDIWMVICKIVIPFSFEFVDLSSETNKLILAFLLMIASLMLYYIISTNILFYSLLTQKIYQVTILILSLTNSLLFIDLSLLYFGFEFFDGFFELWCFTLLFIVLYHVFSSENYAKALPGNIKDLSTPNQAIKGIMALLRLIHDREHNKEYEVILTGYIIYHIEVCFDPECHLSKYQQSKNSNYDYSIPEHSILIMHLKDLFIIYLVLFPSDIPLRIMYSLFALEVLDKVNICKVNVITAMSSNPSIQQEFCLYRIKKIIEDDYLNLESADVNLQIASTIVFDQYFQQFQDTIKLLGAKYLEFWNSFVLEETNMKKIRELGKVILSLIHNVFDLWKKLQDINPNDYDCIRLYGQFQLDIMNNKQLSELYMIKSQEIIKTSGREIKLFKNDINHLCIDGAPVLIASQICDQEGNDSSNSGLVISQVTNSFIQLFQYQKNELLGKDINILLPIELRDIHSKSVKEFLKQTENKKAIEKRKIKGVALNKSSFIFPIRFNMILLPNLTKEANLAIRIKQTKKISHYTCHIMINAYLDIKYISSQAIKLLNISDKGLWCIKNSKKVHSGDRINIRYLIKEINNIILSSKQNRQYLFQRQETKSRKTLLSLIPNQQSKDHKLLSKLIEEKNTIVHLYDFQEVYLVSHSDNNNNNNVKDHYVTTVLSSQIDKNILVWNITVNEEYKTVNKNSNYYLSSRMNVYDITFNQMQSGYYVIALDYVRNDTKEKEKGEMDALYSFNTLSTTNLKMTGFLNKMTNISDCMFKTDKFIKFDIQTGVFAVEVNDKNKTSTMMAILSPTNFKNTYFNNTIIHRINSNTNVTNNKNNNNTGNANVVNSNKENKEKSDERSELSNSFTIDNEEESLHNKSTCKDNTARFSRDNILNLTQYQKPNRRKGKAKTKEKSKAKGTIERELNIDKNVYNALFFQDYSENILYYDLDLNTLTCSIFTKTTPKEGKSLSELTHFFEDDTLKIDDDITNMRNNEDSDFHKAKYDINKNYIFKQKLYQTHLATSKPIIISWLIYVLHLSFTISALVSYNTYLTKTKHNILTMSRMGLLLNYTLTSTSYFIDTLVFRYLSSFVSTNSRITLYNNITQKLQSNAKVMYHSLSITDLFLDETFAEIDSIKPMNITMHLLVNVNNSGIPLTSASHIHFIEATNYIIAAIYTLGANPNINTDYFNPNSFFLCFNSINDYYLNMMSYLHTIKTIILEKREPDSSQLVIIYVSIAFNIVLIFILYLLIRVLMKKMNEIILEFLSISQVEALFIKKKIEQFIKNIHIYDIAAEEAEETEDDIELIEGKRNNKFIADKMRQLQTDEIIVIAFLFTLFIALLFDLLTQYLVINSYDNNTNQIVNLYYTLNEFMSNVNLLSIGVKIRLFANRDITMLNEPIDLNINKQFDLFVVLKDKMVSEIQTNGLFSINFTKVYNDAIALDQLPFSSSVITQHIESLERWSFDYTLAYYYNTLFAFYSYSFELSKEDALKDPRILYSNEIKDNVLGPYLSLINKAVIEECINRSDSMITFVFVWFWLFTLLSVIAFLFAWLPLLIRLEQEVTNMKCMILLIPTNILMKKKAILDILKNENMISIRK